MVGKENESSRDQDKKGHDGGGREDAPNASFPKILHLKVTSRDLFGDDGGDEITGNDEEDIDPHKSAGESERGVEENDRNDCKRPESVDIGAVTEAFEA